MSSDDNFFKQFEVDESDNFFAQFTKDSKGKTVTVKELLRGKEGPPGLNVKGDPGPKGDSIKGDPGKTIIGPPGTGIANMFMRPVGIKGTEAVFILTDGRELATGNLKGDKGEEGDPGEPGEHIVGGSGDISVGRFNRHAQDTTIHFTVASISHLAIQDIGTNSHAAIDTHIADGTIHYTLGSFGLSGLTDNAVMRANGSAALQDSGVIISDADAITGVTKLTVDNLILDGNTLSSSSGDIALSPTANLTVDSAIIANAGTGTATIGVNPAYIFGVTDADASMNSLAEGGMASGSASSGVGTTLSDISVGIGNAGGRAHGFTLATSGSTAQIAANGSGGNTIFGQCLAIGGSATMIENGLGDWMNGSLTTANAAAIASFTTAANKMGQTISGTIVTTGTGNATVDSTEDGTFTHLHLDNNSTGDITVITSGVGATTLGTIRARTAGSCILNNDSDGGFFNAFIRAVSGWTATVNMDTTANILVGRLAASTQDVTIDFLSQGTAAIGNFVNQNVTLGASGAIILGGNNSPGVDITNNEPKSTKINDKFHFLGDVPVAVGNFMIWEDSDVMKIQLAGIEEDFAFLGRANAWTKLQTLDGGIKENLSEQTGNYTLLSTDIGIVFLISSNAIATLLDPTGNTKQVFYITNKYTSTANVTFSRNIDGDSSFTLLPGETISIQSDGTEYLVTR